MDKATQPPSEPEPTVHVLVKMLNSPQLAPEDLKYIVSQAIWKCHQAGVPYPDKETIEFLRRLDGATSNQQDPTRGNMRGIGIPPRLETLGAQGWSLIKREEPK